MKKVKGDKKMSKKEAINWANIPPYEWPASCSEAENVKKFAALSTNLQIALKNKNGEKIEKAVEAVLVWGNVNDSDKVKDFSASIAQLFRDDEKKQDTRAIIRMGKIRAGTNEITTWRIASWTKVLAAAFPGKYYIYDARVAYGLCKMDPSVSFQIPPSRQRDIEDFKVQRTGKCLTMPESYECYLKWLQENAPEISDELFSVYESAGIKDRMQARMAHAEKLLFMVIERDKQQAR